MRLASCLAILLVAPGAIAISFRVLPGRDDGRGTWTALVPGSRCRTHIAGLSGENETSVPCDAKIDLPARPSAIWIEDGTSISFPVLSETLRGGDTLLALHKALAVRVRATSEHPRSLSVVRLPDTHGVSFRRRVDGARDATVLLPEGEVVAYESDARDRVIALSAPRKGKAGETLDLEWLPRLRSSDVVAFVEWPAVARPASSGLRFHLNDGEDVAPAIAFSDAAGALAVWYGRTRDRALLSAEAEELALAPADLQMTGGVATFRGRFRQRPQLHVTVTIPDDAAEAFDAAHPTVQLTSVANDRVVAEASIAARTPIVWKKLPLETVVAELRIRNVRYRETVDLTQREDNELTFPIAPIRINGSVRTGDRPLRASVGFRTGLGDVTATESDDSGEYAVVLWNPDRYVLEVAPLDEPGLTPQAEMVLLSASRRLDIRIPRGSIGVRVVDAATGQPIEKAEVGGMIRWKDPDQGSRSRSFFAKTDATGAYALDLLRTGTVEVRASASGYRDSEMIRVAVVEDNPRHQVTIELEAEERKTVLQLLLPGGRPAANAELLVAADASAQRTLWRGHADADGKVRLPEIADGSFIFVRHREAGATVRRWRGGIEREPWTLSTAASRLTVQVARRGGGTFPTAFVAIAIAGEWTSGTALEFLTGTPAWVDVRGVWTGDRLPAASSRMIAWRARPVAEVLGGAYDALALPLPFPWPPTLVVETID